MRGDVDMRRVFEHCFKMLRSFAMIAALGIAMTPQAGAMGGGMTSTTSGGGGGGMGGVTITAAYVPGAAGLDPADAAWAQATPATVTLERFIDYVEGSGGMGGGGMQCMMMGQAINQPVTVRVVHNGTDIFFRAEWSDSTADTTVDDTNLFGDALAMEIPYSGTGNTSLAMGNQTEPVNIMFWRADLAQPQNIVAGGIGTPQPSPDAQNLQRYQNWSSGTWTIIMARPMVGASDNQITLTRGASYNIAFANWNGSDKNRDGRKAISNWNTLQIQ